MFNEPSPFQQERPTIQMAPLIDIVFLTLIFFMTMALYSQMESEISISVPKSKTSTEAVRSPGEIMINITEDGQFIINQKKVDLAGLDEMLKNVAKLFPDQPVIIRADENTKHKSIIQVLDTCASANIWDISFATTKTEKN
jgi:biopolymer transport protein ExbD